MIVHEQARIGKAIYEAWGIGRGWHHLEWKLPSLEQLIPKPNRVTQGEMEE